MIHCSAIFWWKKFTLIRKVGKVWWKQRTRKLFLIYLFTLLPRFKDLNVIKPHNDLLKKVINLLQGHVNFGLHCTTILSFIQAFDNSITVCRHYFLALLFLLSLHLCVYRHIHTCISTYTHIIYIFIYSLNFLYGVGIFFFSF